MSLLPILTRLRQPNDVALPARQIFDQGDVNCCFSCAVATAMEARDPAMPPLAPLYHFHNAGGARVIDEGLTHAEAKLAMLTKGVCAFERHPFDITRPNVSTGPDDDAVQDGIARKPMDRSSGTLLWRSVLRSDPERFWKRFLSAGAPIIIGIQPNASYLALDAQHPKLTNIDATNGRTGHAAAIIGFRDSESSFIVQDSRRGTDFGAGGQWFLPYSMATLPFVVLAIALAPDDAE